MLAVVTAFVRRKRRRRREEGEVAREEEVDQWRGVCFSVLESFVGLHSHVESVLQEEHNGPPLVPAPLPPYSHSLCYWEQRGSVLGEGGGAHCPQEVYLHSSGADLDC